MLAERLLAPVIAARVDTLVLGCTHYPLLSRTIGDVMGPDVVLVSSAEETAFEVRDRLRSRDTARDRHDPRTRTGSSRAATSTSSSTLGARFLGPEVESVESWRW